VYHLMGKQVMGLLYNIVIISLLPISKKFKKLSAMAASWGTADFDSLPREFQASGLLSSDMSERGVSGSWRIRRHPHRDRFLCRNEKHPIWAFR